MTALSSSTTVAVVDAVQTGTAGMVQHYTRAAELPAHSGFTDKAPIIDAQTIALTIQNARLLVLLVSLFSLSVPPSPLPSLPHAIGSHVCWG
jgi:hypothetical protein